MKRQGLISEEAPIQDRWVSSISGNRPTLPQSGKEGIVLYVKYYVLVTLNVNDDLRLCKPLHSKWYTP